LEIFLKLTFHHINYVSKNVNELNNFYKNILQMDTVPETNFPRTSSTDNSGYDGKIKFLTEGSMQMHLAEKNLNVAKINNQHINPVEKGHIAFRTDDIEAFKKILIKNNINFADYGTAFAKEWYQIFFYDPEGNIVEVHQLLKN
jgi:catechol 2,3-dioxygenase-like lactoylglutathione lyase family enzyme|tara:strand:- start:1582 stop:2013 length:432 start_codon:yes stop_codon:yes gene_type:complete